VLSFANVGATSLFSTPEDLVLWLDNFRTHKLGSDRVFANMLEVPSLSSGEPAKMFGFEFAAGLALGNYRGLKTIGHGGSDAGFRASIEWFPEQNTGIAITTNLASGDPVGHLHKVADVALKASFPESAPATAMAEEFIEVDKPILERYEGVFQIKDAGLMTLNIDEDELKADIAGMGVVVLKPLSETMFLIEEFKARISFEADEQNRYDHIKIIMATMEMPGTRLAPLVLTPETTMAYSGTYYSPELRTQWDLSSSDGKLFIQHSRHGNIALLADPSTEPGKQPVKFFGDQWFVSELVFDVDETGATRGFRVNGSRVKNLWFQKL